MEWIFFVGVLLSSTDRSRDVYCAHLFIQIRVRLPRSSSRHLFLGFGLAGSRPLLGFWVWVTPLCGVDLKLFTFSSNLIGEWQRFLRTSHNQFEHWHTRWKSGESDFWRTVRISFQHLFFIDTSFIYHHHHSWDDSLFIFLILFECPRGSSAFVPHSFLFIFLSLLGGYFTLHFLSSWCSFCNALPSSLYFPNFGLFIRSSYKSFSLQRYTTSKLLVSKHIHPPTFHSNIPSHFLEVLRMLGRDFDDWFMKSATRVGCGLNGMVNLPFFFPLRS